MRPSSALLRHRGRVLAVAAALGARNHGCFRVDVRFVWNMVAHDLVPLGRNVRRILALEED
jgi:hypothetical protein